MVRRFCVLAGFAAVATVVQASSPCQSLQVDPWGADSFRIRVISHPLLTLLLLCSRNACVMLTTVLSPDFPADWHAETGGPNGVKSVLEIRPNVPHCRTGHPTVMIEMSDGEKKIS